MTTERLLLALACLLLSATAAADVLDAAPGGFTIQHEAIVRADRETVWAAAVSEIDQWWNASHTVSGDAGRLSIDARPMGCFCESLREEDGVVHLIVSSVDTNVMLRMTGGLGPLGLMGVSGNMTWEFFDSDLGTRVRFTYAVGGYMPEGLDVIAGPVDRVIGEALQLLQNHVEQANPD